MIAMQTLEATGRGEVAHKLIDAVQTATSSQLVYIYTYIYIYVYDYVYVYACVYVYVCSYSKMFVEVTNTTNS